MSIVPISSLSGHELAALGHNLLGVARGDRRELREAQELRAVNRSLAVHQERGGRLRPPFLTSWSGARLAG